MPDFVQILAVEPAWSQVEAPLRERVTAAGAHWPSTADDLHTWATLQESLLELAKVSPEVHVRVLLRQRADWILLSVFEVGEGLVEEAFVAFCTGADECTQPLARPAPDVALALDVEAASLVERVARACDELEEPEARDRSLRLPFFLTSVDAAVEALAHVAGHLAGPDVRLLVELETPAQFCEVTLSRQTGVTIAGLHPWLDDEPQREWARRWLPKAVPARTAPPRR